ncbi:hypothetical protein [Halorussus sp. MSC15.2]|uniref:hypothetical protein n=1 Tax=Halorussus sp. MSC15.2 TaxID=2283638 RepID=UPI0013D7F02B|nr:hypothetical protein [Halorussus sp. MSC15.2]NEU59185.1 hypothetical protein [Halorussus sp. MSC15.2]
MESSLPGSYDVTWSGTTYTYSIETWWENENHTRSYPEVILGWNERNVEKQDAQSMGRVVAVNERPGENVYEYTYATRLYDELTVTCLVEDATNADSVPPKPRVESFAETLWSHFRYDFDQNSTGSNGERPVVARISSDQIHEAHTDSAGTDVQEYEFRVRLHYTDRHTETVDSTEDVEYTVTTN